MRKHFVFPFLLSLLPAGSMNAEVMVTGVSSNTDADYAADASASDLVNTGSPSLAAAPTYSETLFFGPADNDGTVGTANNTDDISFWINAPVGATYSITYPLDTSTNTLGYDINAIQTIHGWTNNSGNQKNQNYTVDVSLVGEEDFNPVATVAFLPFGSGGVIGSTKVNITEDTTGILASGVDAIRFTYTIPASGGAQPSPTIREIDVFGSAVSSGPDTTPPTVVSLNPENTADDVAPDSNLVMTFNEAVVIGTGSITLKNLDTPSSVIIPVDDPRISISGTSLTINPAVDFDPNTNYAVQIASSAIEDLAGNSFAGIDDDTTWAFSTENTVFSITAPVSRQVVQRDTANLGSIPVSGVLGGPVDRVEARAVAPPFYDKDLGAIWFIGDSITQSNADGDGNGSPRKSLYDLLLADSASFTFTGHSTSNIDGLPATGGTPSTNLYHYHSGVSGSVIGASGGRTNMTANIPGWWNSGRLASTRPEIVLIMLGTNDIDLNADVAGAPARIKLLVDTILAQVGAGDPDPAIFVAQIPPNTGSAAELQRVVDFNDALPAVVATLQGEGKDVTLVDQFSRLNADIGGLMRDSLHTNAAGNDVLASQWFEAIKTRFALSSSATTTPWQTIATNPVATFGGNLTGVTAGGWYSVEVRTVTNDVPANSTSIEKIGVGDIYVTCGQSNSANFGSPRGTVSDDRVSAWDFSSGIWSKAADPMPGANGSGGSVWPRLGDLLAARDDVPVAFACLGIGGSRVSQWVPPGGNYPRISAAMNAFPVQGFQGVLWHQGESDSLSSTAPATYQSRLESIIAQSRLDAGWEVPWYIAEVSFHPNSNLSQEEPVVAGQRRAIFNDPEVFPGPVTDDFHLEGKLSDGVHFNGAGLADHAAQWAGVLGGSPPVEPKNGAFEANTALPDGGVAAIDPTLGSSPSVIGWRALAASGETVADGSCGYFNPDDTTYAGTDDAGANGGVLPGMSGRHVAFLSGSSAGAHFLQTRRALVTPGTIYTLTVALGVRRDPSSFGGGRLEILANGAVVAGGSFDKATLDTLRGSDASGTFTEATVSWNSGPTPDANQPLAIRVIKEGGNATVLDFDQVLLAASPAPDFETWINGFGLPPSGLEFGSDPDGDGLANGVEAFLGTDPSTQNPGLFGLSTNGTATTFAHSQNTNPLAGVEGSYQWSSDLTNWYASGDQSSDGLVVSFTPSSQAGVTTVTALASAPADHLYFRIIVSQNP